MDPSPTPAPATAVPAETWPPLPGVVTKGIDTEDGAFAALIGGIVGSMLLLLICIIVVLLWCLSRHKGSYITNEMDDADADEDDDESVGSDTALQSREPLTTKDDE
ncbi:glycophorin-C [Sebastes fasciatus]|uniref:glycophorin-C n=1 Tax=Sebastes fasciatus TaxID=394691 RepID=UPI003D9EE6AF